MTPIDQSQKEAELSRRIVVLLADVAILTTERDAACSARDDAKDERDSAIAALRLCVEALREALRQTQMGDSNFALGRGGGDLCRKALAAAEGVLKP